VLLLCRNDGRGRVSPRAALCPPLTQCLIQPHISVLSPSTASMGLKAPVPTSSSDAGGSSNELQVRALNNGRVTLTCSTGQQRASCHITREILRPFHPAGRTLVRSLFWTCGVAQSSTSEMSTHSSGKSVRFSIDVFGKFSCSRRIWPCRYRQREGDHVTACIILAGHKF
jgi:hypothetical protein